MPIADADPNELIPLALAARNLVPGSPNPSTIWRWATKGLAAADPSQPRVKLSVVYVGCRPHTTAVAIREFLSQATAARLARIDERRRASMDTSDDELRTAGLL